MNKKIITSSLVNALGVTIYTSLVSWLMLSGENIFGKMSHFWGPLAFLLLFILSACVVGVLVLGKPVMLYLENKKSEAVKLLLFTILWLFVATALTLLIQLF